MVARTCEDEQQLELLSNVHSRFSYTLCHELYILQTYMEVLNSTQ